MGTIIVTAARFVKLSGVGVAMIGGTGQSITAKSNIRTGNGRKQGLTISKRLEV